MDKILAPFRQGALLNKIFVSSIFLSLHTALIVYINSSFLSKFFSESQVSALYAAGAILSIILLLKVPQILNSMGGYKMTVYAILFEGLAIIGFTVSSAAFLTGAYFLLQQMAVSMLLISFDLYVEELSTDESKTGEIRSGYLTIGNLIYLAAPLTIAIFLTDNAYWKIYLLSIAVLIPLYWLFRKFFKSTVLQPLRHIKLRETIIDSLRNKNIYSVIAAQFLLQLFYTYMIIYMPLYLEHVMGFTWTSIGLMFTIMLLPFVLIEIPVGDLADEKYGEKEFLAIGFIIMGLSTLCISFISSHSFWIWTAVLFATRIGASLVEVTTDSYFFKQVTEEKANVISFYRMTRPLSSIAGPALAVLSLAFIPFQYAFLVLGALMIVGTHYALALVDTK